MRKVVPIKYSIERVVLSDVLPFETPITFSNRYFYQYLNKRNKSIKNEVFKAKRNKAFSEIEFILFGSANQTKPFSFYITHRKNDFRELSIIHPSSQKKVLNFYKEFKDLIIYYCSISPFSLRKPTKVANYIFYNDIFHKKTKNGDLEHSQIEQDDNEYENLKSFFTYQKYSNIYKFFESYQFHRSEKKYNKLLKIDISKCFDSVYSHTVSWAIFNKGIVKENIVPSRNTFAGKFDELVQKLNANETNGIIIGPEFSRIFAEIILQQIDKDILDRLKDEDEYGFNLVHKVNYEIFRYVDDYFIFYNKDTDIDRIIREFKLALKEYKMYLNENKSVYYEKPIITEISIAKQKISDLFNENLLVKQKENKGIFNESETKVKTDLYFYSNEVITRFKLIIKESKIEYKEIMNYSLAALDRKTAKLIEQWKEIKEEEYTHKIEKEFEKGFLEILDVAFFLYSVAPRVNSTIKICLIISKIISFLKRNSKNDYTEPFLPNNKHTVLKKISDEIFLILEKNKTKKETQVETLYLLVASSQLGREYRLNYKVLCSYFNIKVLKGGKLDLRGNLNYFSITVLLFYVKNIKAYGKIKELVKTHIFNKFKEKVLNDWQEDTELVLLLLDVLSCPYLNNEIPAHIQNKIDEAKEKGSTSLKRYQKEACDYKYKDKRELLSFLCIKKNHKTLIEQEKFWFTKWTDFDFELELQAKRSQEVY